MTTVLLIIHLLVSASLVAVVLMQRSEGGALGVGGGGPGGMMSGRGAANMLTRLTMILGGAFMGVSILLAVVSGMSGTSSSVLDGAQESEEGLPFSFDDEQEFDLPGDEAETPAIPDGDAPAEQSPAETAPADDDAAPEIPEDAPAEDQPADDDAPELPEAPGR